MVLLTALLHNLNGPIIRIYEGYPWCDSWIGGWRKRAHRQKMESAQARWNGLWTLLLDAEAQRHPGYDKVVDHWNDLARTLNNDYPDEPEAVLPTRLGNVIRSFESYSWRQYRIRAITVWPRLAAMLEQPYAELIDDAKSTLDFMLNASLLCGALAALVAGVRLVFPVGLATPSALVTLAAELATLGGLAYAFYLAAIPRAHAWGMTVKGAFDLFRWKLLEALGYRWRPETLSEERVLWEKISERIILSDLQIDPLPAYELHTVATGVEVAPEKLKLVLVRGASRPAADSLKITIRVHNPDAARLATGVVITDTVPEGWAYEWGSAAASIGAVEVSGTNPYRFEIADLAPAAAALVTYRAVPVGPPTP